MDDMRISQFYGLNKLIDYIKFRAWSRYGMLSKLNACYNLYFIIVWCLFIFQTFRQKIKHDMNNERLIVKVIYFNRLRKINFNCMIC